MPNFRRSIVLAIALVSPAAISPEDGRGAGTPRAEQSNVEGRSASNPRSEKTALPGHSMHGEAFNEGPRQRAYLREGTGKVDFPITTSNAEAQAFFNQGVGQLHGFWYLEAERSFRQAAALDAQCAMAYWGMAQANINNEPRAKQFIAKAQACKEAVSAREQLWIEAFSEYLEAGSDRDKERRRTYVRRLENLIELDPRDLEAKAFLAVQLWWNDSHGWPINSHTAVDAIIEEVLSVEPMHPAHHYRIHIWDNEMPRRALGSAALCGRSAPAIAHMWHMPGHTYSNLHRYHDACWQQEASARVDHAHMIRDGVLPDQIHNYAHNNEWLIRNLNHVGRVRDAVALATNLVELPRHPKYNTLEREGGCSAKFGRERLLQTLVRFEQWDDLVRLANTPLLEPAEDIEQELPRLRALGLAYFALHREREGERIMCEVSRRMAHEEGRLEQARRDAAEIGAKEQKTPDEICEIQEEAGAPIEVRMRPLRKAIAELQGVQRLMAGDMDAAFFHFDQADDIPAERMVRYLVTSGRLEQAEAKARELVREHENEVVPLALHVWALWKGGRQDQAREAFEKLRIVAGGADTDAPPLARLAPLAAQLAYPADWRIAQAAPDDVGDRPPLESLGPIHWIPSAAPPWTLSDADGTMRSLEEYRGRPLVLILYLGHGCLHCVEQLRAFAPMSDAFRDAGIELAAVGTDSPAELRLASRGYGEEFPFPLLSDARLEVFHAYRAFDDFEGLPMHATFLVDARGRVRWQDIGHEPFQDAAFLLREARRLLAMPTLRDTDSPALGNATKLAGGK